MHNYKFELPVLLKELIKTNIWPNNKKDSNVQNSKQIVDKKLLNDLIPDEEMLFLYNPPFQTVYECILREEYYWNLPQVKPSLNQIIPEKTLIIGDFGFGTETVLALDYRDSDIVPSVVRFKWYSENPIEKNKWIKVADDFDDFASALGLDKLSSI